MKPRFILIFDYHYTDQCYFSIRAIVFGTEDGRNMCVIDLGFTTCFTGCVSVCNYSHEAIL